MTYYVKPGDVIIVGMGDLPVYEPPKVEYVEIEPESGEMELDEYIEPTIEYIEEGED